MKNQRMRVPSIVAAIAGIALVSAACTIAAPKPTPNYVFGTPSPVSTSTAGPDETATDTPAVPTETPANAASPTVGASVSPSPSPSPSPTGPAGGCSGTADTKSFFSNAANHFKIAVYCVSVTKGWTFKSASNSWPGVAKLSATYAGPSGAKIVIQEGAFCTAGASACSPHVSNLGTAQFGTLSGDLDTTSTGFAIYANPGTAQGYTATGTSVSQATFVKIVGALYLVAKS